MPKIRNISKLCGERDIGLKRYVEREKSIYVQILLLLVVAAAIAGGLFLILDRVGEYSIDRYIENSDYIETRTGQAV